MKLTLFLGDEIIRDDFLRDLVHLQYERNDIDFSRGKFRVRGDIVEIFPAHEESNVIRIELFDHELEMISLVDPLTGKIIEELNKVTIYPSSHYVVGEEKLKRAIETISEELRERLNELQTQEKLVEAQRLEQRTLLDLEMLEEMGFCPGVENYSSFNRRCSWRTLRL